MNCKILFSAAAIAATTLFASCTQEVDVDANYATHQTFYADLVEPEEDQDPLSRTSVNVNNTSSTTFLWEPDDKIGVYSADGSEKNVLFSNKSTKKVASTQFSGEFNGTPYYAYAPYSANNNGVALSAVKGTILTEQPYDHETASLTSFYRYGTCTNASKGTFTFKLLLSMLKLTIDATGTGLEGERLTSIVVTVVDKDGKARKIAGDFTFNATNGKYTVTGNTSNQLTMPWPKKPLLSKNKSYRGYLNILPDVAIGDKMTFEITTEGHKATFTTTITKNYKVATVYGHALTLKTYKASAAQYNYEEVAIERPEMSDFKFEVKNNEGKLLNNELKWNSSSHTPSFSSVSEHKATVDNEKYEIALTIPYLYDFKLKPTFSVGSGVKVTVNGVEQKSGETEVDFTKPVVYTITNSEGGTRDYTVKVENTGLPVVVIEHSTSGDFSDEKVGGTNIFGVVIGARTVNTFVDFKIRGKDTDWVKDDQITIYNPDGTVDCSVAGGIRHRGNTSRDYPKKPFAVKFNDEKSVLGMPAHKRWVLLANWLDHSMIRNAVAFDIAHAIEYAWRNNNTPDEEDGGIPWNVHGQPVELIVVDKDNDAHHVGNYFLCEQIKIGDNRLAITSEKGADTGTDYTQYGHLFEIDGNYDEDSKFRTTNKLPFMFKDKVSDAILNAVKKKVQGIEDNINAGNYDEAFKNLDINSVIDQWLIFELTMNREYGDPRSVYMFMNGDGKLSGGPVWDFDRGTFQNQDNARDLGNSDSYRIKPDNEWMCWRTQETSENDNGKEAAFVWYKKLINSSTFQQTVQARWEIMYPYLTQIIPAQIQYYGQTLAKSYKYDSAMWPTNKSDVREYKSDFKDWSGDEELGANGNYQEVINNFITVYNERLAGMDGLITSGKFTE